MDFKKDQFFRLPQEYEPFYMTHPMHNVYLDEIEYERDMDRMKEMYPKQARGIQEQVEVECDKMEYEGSLMFDEHPDRLMLRQICNSIYERVRPQEVETMVEDGSEITEEGVKCMNFHIPQKRREEDGLHDLIEILLYNEIYNRRCRHRRCKKWW